MAEHTDHFELVKTAADVGAVVTTIGVLMSWLPSIAAVLTVLWLGVRLFNEVVTSVRNVRDFRKPGARSED